MSRSLSRLTALLCASLLLPGCGEGEPAGGARDATGAAVEAGRELPPAPTPGHARMQAELARVAGEVMPENRFLGERQSERLAQQLRGLPPSATPTTRFELLTQLASHELRQGRAESALERLAEAEALLPGISERLRGRLAATTWFHQGLAALRLAETRNCVDCSGPGSCLVPFRGAAIHRDTEGSRLAMDRFERFLGQDFGGAEEHTARWLLNIAAMTLGEHPEGVRSAYRLAPTVFASEVEFPRFPNVSAAAGLDAFNLSGGAVVEDLDGDGLLDVLTSNWHYEVSMLLRRNRGDGTFEDVTPRANLAAHVGGLNMIHADVDADGDADVLVLRGAWFDRLGRHPNSLLLNDGAGRFTDVSYDIGLAEPAYPTQAAAFADYDNDGDLDLYVGNEDTGHGEHPSQLLRQDRVPAPAVTGDEPPAFTDVAAEAGVRNQRYAKGVGWGDIDDDGDPDLYVSNFTEPNRLYLNEGHDRFRDVAVERGVERPLMSFPTWFWDQDNDGDLDLYVAAYVEDMNEVAASWSGERTEHEAGRLYRNDGRGAFHDATEQVGLRRLITTMGANFGDLDDDGWLDMYLGTGFPSYTALMPNTMYHSVGGERFEDVSASGGFSMLQKGHAVAFADLDDDGDIDVFEQMGGAYTGDSFHDAAYRNPGFGRRWVRVRLEGVTSNRSAIGARVRADFVDGGEARSVHRVVGTGGSFGSSPLAVHLGLGDAAVLERLEVRWPTSGVVQVFDDVAVDTVYALKETSDVLEVRPLRPALLGGE